MPILEFRNYVVDDMNYTKNKDFKSAKDDIDLKPKVDVKFEVGDSEIAVSLNVIVGSLDNNDMPFEAGCSITGQFIYHPTANTMGVNVKELLENNAVAILYPYARTLISQLTQNSNEYPSYVLPTIDVAEMLKKQSQ